MMGWPIIAVETEMRRLRVLRYLAGLPGYEAAAGILLLHCSQIGVPTTKDQINNCLAWLEEQELVTLRENNGEAIAKINQHGLEVADGSKIVPGVLRPDP